MGEKSGCVLRHVERSLEHEDPSRFVQGPWRRERRVSPHFLAYRIALSLVMLTTLAMSWCIEWAHAKWFIFLTNWGYLLCTAQACTATLLVARAYHRERNGADTSSDYVRMPISYKIYWVLYNMAMPIALYITIVYWSFVYKPKDLSGPRRALDYIYHIGNSVVVLLEVSFGGPPSRVLHGLQPVAFGIAYVVFNAIYWAAGGTSPDDEPWVYEILDWGRPTTACAVTVGSSLLILFLHLGVVAGAGVRHRLSHRRQQPSPCANIFIPKRLCHTFTTAPITAANEQTITLKMEAIS